MIKDNNQVESGESNNRKSPYTADHIRFTLTSTSFELCYITQQIVLWCDDARTRIGKPDYGRNLSTIATYVIGLCIQNEIVPRLIERFDITLEPISPLTSDSTSSLKLFVKYKHESGDGIETEIFLNHINDHPIFQPIFG